MGAGRPYGLPALKFYTGGNVVLTMSLSANTLSTMPDSGKKLLSPKFKSMSITIDKLAPEQVEYLASSGEGT